MITNFNIINQIKVKPNNIHEEIYKDFCSWSPGHVNFILTYKPWGEHSILLLLELGYAYKVKRNGPDKFIMQPVSESDIIKKYNL